MSCFYKTAFSSLKDFHQEWNECHYSDDDKQHNITFKLSEKQFLTQTNKATGSKEINFKMTQNFQWWINICRHFFMLRKMLGVDLHNFFHLFTCEVQRAAQFAMIHSLSWWLMRVLPNCWDLTFSWEIERENGWSFATEAGQTRSWCLIVPRRCVLLTHLTLFCFATAQGSWTNCCNVIVRWCSCAECAIHPPSPSSRVSLDGLTRRAKLSRTGFCKLLEEETVHLRVQGWIGGRNNPWKGQALLFQEGLQSFSSPSVKISVTLDSAWTQFSFDYAYNYQVRLRVGIETKSGLHIKT